MEDRLLLTTFTVIDTLDDNNPGSLRWAIGQTNAGGGGDTIAFSIPAGGVQTISITSALPAITVPVTIDGRTQPLYAGTPLIQLDGTAAGAGVDGLSIVAGGTSVFGLAIGNFGGNAISITGAGGNTVQSNVLGLAADGDSLTPNGGHGVFVNTDNNTIGGPGTGEGNVISGNTGYGISLAGASLNLIEQNIVGLNAAGGQRRGNVAGGILVSNGTNNVIGGTDPSVRNLISSNGGHGIETFGTTDGLLIEGNVIGSDATGVANLGNFGDGIRLFSSLNTVGGVAPGSANVIAFNGDPAGSSGSGVALVFAVQSNAILGNSIFSNVGLGISIGGSGNQSQPAPTLSAASTDGATTTVVGMLSGSDPNTDYRLEFFSNATPDPSGTGEGQVFLGSAQVVTDANGNVSFNLALGTGSPPGAFISATATDPQGNTSEFSGDIQATGTADMGVSLGVVPAAPNVGDAITYTLQVSNGGSTLARGVHSVFQVPANTTLTSATSGDAIVIIGPNSIDFDFGSLDAGETGTATIVVQTSAASAPSIVASANVTSLEGDPVAANNSTTVTTPISPVADLSVTVQGSPGIVSAGSNVTYTVTVNNAGPSAASNVNLVDTLPQNVTLVSAVSNLGTTSLAGNVLTTVIPTLNANGGAAVLTIVVTTNGTTPASITDSATVTATESDPNSADNSAQASTTVTPSSDVQITITDSPDPVNAGQNVTYTVTVTNNGPSPATNINIVDQLPTGGTFVSAIDNGGGTPLLSGSTVTDTIASLAANASVVLTIVVQAPGVTTGSLTDSATVTAAESDANGSNNLASATTTVNPVSDLSVAIVGTPGTVGAGQSVTYTVTVRNNGPTPASGVTLVDTLPANVTVGTVTVSQGTTTRGSGTVTGNIGPLQVGATATMTIVITTAGASVPSITDTVTASGNETDSDPTNNTASTSTGVTPVADLSVTIGQTPGSVHVNDNLTYTLTVTNNGPSAATGVALIDTLPAGATFISASDSLGRALNASGGAVVDNIGALASGATVTVTIVVQAATLGQLINSATVSGAENDGTPLNNTSLVTTAVVALSDLAVTVFADQAQLTRGQTLTYVATVTNNGPSEATGVTLSDQLPAGMTVISLTPSQGSVTQTNGQITASFGNLAVGAVATLTIVVTPTTLGPATNTASVLASEDDPNQGNNSANVDVEVLDLPGTIQFATSTLTVNENAGTATIVVTRTDGAQGQVSVNFVSSPGTAVVGLDFGPVSGTLVFAQGETSKVITLPVLINSHNRGDKTVRLTLFGVEGGAVLGARVVTTVVIHDLNPDVVAPTVQDVRLFGPATSIQTVALFFSEGLDPVKATRANLFQIIDVGPDGKFGTRDDRPVPLRAPIYGVPNTVSLQPLRALQANRFYYVRALGQTDLAGNPLSAGPGGVAGGGFAMYVARGTNLRYPDSRGTQVSLKLTGGGLIDVTRFANGEGQRIQVLKPIPRRTVLTGGLRGGVGATTFQSLTGLGIFGQVRVNMTTPPFFVAQMPFDHTIISPPAVDGVLASGGVAVRSVRGPSR